jgi:hypothetical protein
VIEHLTKEDGYNLISSMEGVAKKRAIIFTPNGFLPQDIYHDNEAQRHLSGWGPEEMRELGYRIIGIQGWKPLRGERGMIRFHPTVLWERFSLLTQILTTRLPKYAFRLLCVKEL